MRNAIMVLLCVFLACSSGEQSGTVEQMAVEVVSENIDYAANGVALKGYLAYDKNKEGKRPGVLVVHEWWGHNDYARKRADMLAELGYTALAVDMYGDGKTAEHPDDAGKFMMEVINNMPAGEARFNAALELLKGHATVDPEKTAAIGYCFGGGVAMHMARIGTDLDAVAAFHGGLDPDVEPEPGSVKAKILVCAGDADPFIKPENVTAFEESMQAANVDYELVMYEGAKHSFTNPGATEVGTKFGLPLEYNEAADKDSWEKMKTLFASVFPE